MNGQERTQADLLNRIRTTLEEAREFNRGESLRAAASG